MDMLSQTPEEKIFAAHLADVIENASKRRTPVFSQFMDTRKQTIAMLLLKGSRTESYSFFGGYSEAEHKVLALHSGNLDEQAVLRQAPISVVKVTYKKNESLTHRDFLGALMSLRLSRESFGDIIVSDDRGTAHIFVLKNMAEIVASELKSVGRTGVLAELADLCDFRYEPRFEEIKGTVPSFRLDCVVALMISKSRALAQELIENESVSVAHRIMTQPSKQVAEGSVVSVKRYGRFILESYGAVTKKGRNFVICKKYL